MRSSIISVWFVLLSATACMSKLNEIERSLWDAVRNDDVNLVKQLLENGTDAKTGNSDGLTLLMYLSKSSGRLNNRKQILELVLPESDPIAADNEGNTALMKDSLSLCVYQHVG